MLTVDSSFEDLMASSYQEVGMEGSPFRLPAWLRRLTAGVVSQHPGLLGATLTALHKLWSLGGPFQSQEVARFWCQMARRFEYGDGLEFAMALKELDQFLTFQEGCQQLGHHNCLEAMYRRAGFLDVFYDREDEHDTPYSHPHQRPHFFVPGIPAQRYYKASRFPWTEILERECRAIKAELQDVLEQRLFGDYRTEYGNLMSGWNTFFFWLQGERIEKNHQLCPHTSSVLDSLPGLETEMILFSALAPGSRIIPHVGTVNGILRFHLPLLAPQGCGLRVGGEVRHWKEGEVLVFDDSFVHEVWNDSSELRVVLFLNAWHPCLSDPERTALARVQSAYNQFPGGKQWKTNQRSSLKKR